MFANEQHVEASSVADFLSRYKKHDRFHGRGEDYIQAQIATYQADLDRDGYVFISRHDSVTGQIVVWRPGHEAETVLDEYVYALLSRQEAA